MGGESKTNADMGNILSISSRTVPKHLERIFRKLGAETRAARAARAHPRRGRSQAR